MHLTNYAINKHSSDFVRDDDSGSKRRITTLNQWFIDQGYDVDKIWHDIEVLNSGYQLAFCVYYVISKGASPQLPVITIPLFLIRT